MRILLVEPDYRRNSGSSRNRAKELNDSKHINDESLWYPPLGLMKLATFHKRRNDKVDFVYGCDEDVTKNGALFPLHWDRIYITTLFTYQWKRTIETINFYKKLLNGDVSKVFIGGIMASLMPNEIFEETGIRPVKGIITSQQQIGLDGEENIDTLPPDYEIVDNKLYAINDTYYAYTSRGCVNDCKWCGVPEIEGDIYYIDVKDTIKELRELYGDKPRLKLMDNNTLACPEFEQIVDDLLDLGYGKGTKTTAPPYRERVIDFNQGLDATYLTEDKMKLLAELNISPMRIAFDRISEKDEYIRAISLANKYGVKNFSNYMLYNFNDTPKDLYERLRINIQLNQEFRRKRKKQTASIYSFPMRYAPIHSSIHPTSLDQGNDISTDSLQDSQSQPWLNKIFWTRRFTRSVEIMKGVAHGAIPPTPTLAKRTIGESYERFILNLYMPEELLRFRNKYEKRVYKSEPKRESGTGDVEKFRKYILKLLKTNAKRFVEFHNLVSKNSKVEIRKYLENCEDEEMRKWLKFYLL